MTTNGTTEIAQNYLPFSINQDRERERNIPTIFIFWLITNHNEDDIYEVNSFSLSATEYQIAFAVAMIQYVAIIIHNMASV